MPTSSQNFIDRENPLTLLDRLVRRAMCALFTDVCLYPHLVREHELVNRFVFAHLVREFEPENLDLTQIGIECPVRVSQLDAEYKAKHTNSSRQKPGPRKDLVIWPHSEATLWCGCKPLAVIEWTFSNWISKGKRREHEWDCRFIEVNTPIAFSSGYAVYVHRDQEAATLQCISKNPVNLAPLELTSGLLNFPAAVRPDANFPTGRGIAGKIARAAPWCTKCLQG
jgi:hypothetical protein